MTRIYTNISLDKRMKNNKEKNKQFEAACREAGSPEKKNTRFPKCYMKTRNFKPEIMSIHI